MNKLIVFAMVVSLGSLTACWKEQVRPALQGGECEISSYGFNSEGSANSEMIRLSAILNNKTIGNADLKIIRQQTYVSWTRLNKPNEWAYQVVFTCGDAAIHTEYETFYNDATRDVAYNTRLAAINSESGAKVISSSIGYYDYNCTDILDDVGNKTGEDCDTGPDYTIYWVKVNVSELQGKILAAYNLYAGTAQSLGFGKPSLEDVLGVAKRILPSGTDSYQVADAMKTILSSVKNPTSRPNKQK